ncbi:MAG: DUF359 domain-containing protein [Acidilobaceae archaeon]
MVFGLYLRLPDKVRVDFTPPWGPVFSGALSISGWVNGLVCVGDYVSRLCLESSIGNLILVFDGVTRRSDLLEPLGVPSGFSFYRVSNIRGTISLEAYALICGLLSRDTVRAAILVDGEEDMLALPAIACLKPGWAVVYGIPGVGACIVEYELLASRIAQIRLLQLVI